MSSFHEEYRSRRPHGDDRFSPAAFEERRQLALDRLTEAFASDLITMDGYEARVSAVQNAKAPEEVDEAVSGLPAAAPKGKRSPASRSGSALANPLDDRLHGEESVACIMSNKVLQGDWLSGDRISSFTLMGNTQIDLRDTALPPGRLKIEAFCMMGNLKVIVPRGLPVKLNAFPFMGNSHIDRDVDRRVNRGEPYLQIDGFSFMGNLVVIAG
jgi:hypothetical protein